ncbi:Pheromone-binding protein-related protein [Apis cerana cerana]|uniref:Pheromone-binding protein-related protein n=1 Tax=Apis cerana cerana TaxID=94128 RepID=A0A2A3EEU4_APICC|nr:Pheromone-binding protein-related protein [Apis cerana cerana]
MKTIVIISAICVCVSAMTHEELKSGIHTLQSICMPETGATEQIANDVDDGKINIDDKNVLLYVECAMKKFNTVDDNGNFNEEVTRDIVRAVLDENETEQLITQCSPISDTDVHVKISKILQCFFKFRTVNDVLNS